MAVYNPNTVYCRYYCSYGYQTSRAIIETVYFCGNQLKMFSACVDDISFYAALMLTEKQIYMADFEASFSQISTTVFNGVTYII